MYQGIDVTSETKGTNLLINKENSSDDEVQSDDEELHDLQKSSTDPDGEKEDDDSSYKEDTMFSDDDYEGFAFIQDVHNVNCNRISRPGYQTAGSFLTANRLWTCS